MLKNCGTVSAMLAKKAEMTAKMPDYKADIKKQLTELRERQMKECSRDR